MSKPFKRPGSDNWWFKQRVPTDIVAKSKGQFFEFVFPAESNSREHPVKVKFGESLTFSLDTTDKQVAIIRCAKAYVEYLQCCGRLRNGTTTSTNPEIRTIAKRLFDYFYDDHLNAETPINYDWLSVDGFKRASDDLRLPEMFAYRDKDYIEDDGRYTLTDAHYNSFPAEDRSRDAMESRYGVICHWALSWLNLRVKQADRYQLLCDFESFLNQARNEQSIRRASLKFNNVSDNESTGPVSFQKIFDEWVTNEKPAYNSIESWRGVVKRFVKFLGHDDASKVTSFDVGCWKDTYSIDSKPSIFTAQTSHFPCIRRMYAVAIERRLLSYNPTSDLTVSLKNVRRERVIPHTTSDLTKVIAAARKQDKPHLKWLPILTILTGARIGELAQLWAEQVKQDSETGIWYLDIKSSPDGGYIKTAISCRRVPIHRGILTEFLAFCQTRQSMPLFYNKPHVNKSKVHPAQSFSQRLCIWYKTLDIDLDNKKPNHSVRHYFKSAAIRARVNMDFIHAIQGHATDKGAFERYQHFQLDDLLKEIESIPFPTISVPADLSRPKEDVSGSTS